MKTTNSTKGHIELIYTEEDRDEPLDDCSKKILQIVDHLKHPGEDCQVVHYANGWTRISYSGVSIVVPNKYFKEAVVNTPFPLGIKNDQTYEMDEIERQKYPIVDIEFLNKE